MLRTATDVLLLATLPVCAFFVLGGAENEVDIWRVVSVKGVLLVAAAWIALSVARVFWGIPGVGLSWLGFGLGLLATGCAELTYSFDPLVRGIELPFPSMADVWFLLGYILLIASLAGFVSAYNMAYSIVSPRTLKLTAAIVMAVLVALGLLVISPALARPDPLMERVLVSTYVLLDVGLLVPLLLLTRAIYKFRGGIVARAWTFLLLGFVAMEVGDVAYSFEPVFQAFPYPYFDELFFVLSYLLLLKGVSLHKRIVTD